MTVTMMATTKALTQKKSPSRRFKKPARSDGSTHKPFYYYCSAIQHKESADITAVQIGVMNDFVTLLHYSVVRLEQQHTVGSPSKFP